MIWLLICVGLFVWMIRKIAIERGRDGVAMYIFGFMTLAWVQICQLLPFWIVAIFALALGIIIGRLPRIDKPEEK